MLLNWFSRLMKHSYNLTFTLFSSKLNKIALQRSKEARVVFQENVCTLNSEMFVFIDESGFVSVHFFDIWLVKLKFVPEFQI